MKVYVVEVGNYDYNCIFGVFSSLTLAHAALIDCNQFNLDTSGEEWNIIGNYGDYLQIHEMIIDEY